MRRASTRLHHGRAALALLFSLAIASAQSTGGTLTGLLQDPTGAPVPAAAIVISHQLTNFRETTHSDSAGAFALRNLPLQTYTVTIDHPGFARFERHVAVRSAVPVDMSIRLGVAESRQSVTVVDGESSALLLDPAQTGTRAQMNSADIDRLSRGAASRGLESVIVTFPGFAQNANGAIHPRGAHNQMTYVIDGMPVTDQLTGAFANAVDPNIVRTVELFTGNIPAEYGSKVSAVANVTTRSGLGSGRRFAGSTAVSAARFDLLSQVTQVSGEAPGGRLGYSATVNTMKSNRYLDAVSLDNLHNGGNSERAFARLDWQASARDIIRFSSIAGRSSFELANLRSQHAAGMDQRQLLRDASGSLAWVRSLTPASVLEAIASYRTADARLLPSAGDTPVTASQERHLSTAMAGLRWNAVQGVHSLRAGFDAQRFPVSEAFTFAVTDPAFGADNPNLRPFQFAARATGALDAGFLQDQLRLGSRWQLSLGLRFDSYRFLARGTQWQPRVGVAYHLQETATVFRASYNRLYQTPPNENLLLSSSAAAAALAPPAVQAALGGRPVIMRPERQDFLEAGLQQALARHASVSVTYYHKRGRDQQDNNNFLNTGIIFPITLEAIRVNSVEARLTVPRTARGWGATFSLTRSRAVSTPPFTGGLYIGNEAVDALSAGPFLIDHDQPLAAHAVVTYNHRGGFYATGSVRYDSGLVANPSDPAEVAADPDHADLLPYVNLAGVPARVRPRTIADASFGYERVDASSQRRRWDASLQISNLTNRTALYNFQSVFVGTRLVQPLTVGARLRWYF
ncbi:MAG: TonB-dependent receptor [Bryobacterales bacterium]|nr:TonB-dependent receptor [Bryobacterales bacterium]